MKPITTLASSTLPDGSVLDLWERDGFHFLLRDGVQLSLIHIWSWMQSPSTAAASSGNIVDATSVIRADDGKEYEVLGIGPIAFLPKYQRR